MLNSNVNEMLYLQIITFQRDHRNRFFKYLVEKAKHDERINRLEK